MTLQTQRTANAPATLSDEQRRRVADALENAQSENTRRNYAGQYRKFRAWCEREDQSALPAQPEVVAAYAAELAEDGKSMSTIRLAVAAVVDAHRRVGLESPQTAGISETLRGLSRQVGVSQKQARPLDADAPVFGLSMSQISRRVDDMARAAGLGEGYSGHSGRVGPGDQDDPQGELRCRRCKTHGRWKSPAMPARYTRGEKALEALEWLV